MDSRICQTSTASPAEPGASHFGLALSNHIAAEDDGCGNPACFCTTFAWPGTSFKSTSLNHV
jgi:hypothetical protein